jgi:hypothetical protein
VGVKIVRDSKATENVCNVLGKRVVMSVAQVVEGQAVDKGVMVIFQGKASKVASAKPVTETGGKGIISGQLMRMGIKLDNCRECR